MTIARPITTTELKTRISEIKKENVRLTDQKSICIKLDVNWRLVHHDKKKIPSTAEMLNGDNISKFERGELQVEEESIVDADVHDMLICMVQDK